MDDRHWRSTIFSGSEEYPALPGDFRERKGNYHFAYNATSEEQGDWLSQVVKAYCTGGEPLNPRPHPGQTKLTTTGYGPQNCEAHQEEQI